MRIGHHRSPRRTTRLGLVTALVVVLALLCVPHSEAQKQTRPLVCRSKSGNITCDLKLRSFFDEGIKEKLRSGLLNRFTYRIYLRRAEDGEPVALAALRLLQVYELWDEVYYVVQQDGASSTRKSADLKDAIGHLAELDSLVVAQGLPPGRYYADLYVELNPLSEEEEAELRAWIARSRGGQSTFATGDRSFFGTFVSLFINIRQGKAERTFRVQTTPFEIKAP